MRRTLPFAAIVLGGLIVANAALLAVGSLRGGGAGGGAVADKRRVRIGLVLDVGGLGDKSFNDGAYAGLKRAESELDIETRFIEPGDGSDRESALRQLAASGMDLVIGVGFIFTDDIRAAARSFPGVHFA